MTYDVWRKGHLATPFLGDMVRDDEDYAAMLITALSTLKHDLVEQMAD